MIRVAFGSVPKDGGTFTLYRNLRPELLRHGIDLRCVSAGRDQAEITEPPFIDDGCVQLAAGTRNLKQQAMAFAEWCEDSAVDIVIGVNSPAILSALPHLPEKIRVLSRCANGFDEGYRMALMGRERIARFIALVPRLRDALTGRYGIDPGRVDLIPNGTSAARFAAAAARARGTGGTLSLGFLGRLEHRQKGVMHLPPILDRLDALGVRYRLDIAGKGKHEPDLRAALGSRTADGRVRFAGALLPGGIPEFLARTDLFLFPSHFEGCPNALLEAMMAGAVPVSWRLHGITDYLLEDGRTGLLCNTGDTEAAASAIAALAGDRARLAGMSRAGAAAARKRFSHTACAAAYKALIEKVLAEAPPAWTPVPWHRFEPDPMFRQRWVAQLLPERPYKALRSMAARLQGRGRAAAAPAAGAAKTAARAQATMRVHQIINSIDLKRGGAERMARLLHGELRKAGADARLVALEACEIGGLDCAVSLGLASPYDPRALLRLGAYARGIAPGDIVHVHLFPASAHAAMLAQAGRLRGRLVFTEHSTSNRRRGHALGGLIDDRVYRAFEKVIAVSGSVEAELLAARPWLAGRTTVIENGCPLAFGRLPQRPAGPRPLRIVSAGRLTPAKNYATALRAVARLGPAAWRYSIAGEGAERAALERQIAELGIEDRVDLMGHVDDVPALLEAADIFLIPSAWEGFGLAAVEAMNAGLPVVASDVPGLRETVGRDGAAALLVPPSDAAGIAAALQRLADDPAMRRRMGAAGFEAAKKYDIARFAAAHRTLYQSLEARPVHVA
ncbi:glycosyltransferase family 4 protein [Leisingera sp. McT4-56]|uniref:glycosyltransferase family 4 protein n=1 Tax=Leisingera sp. McT4-56 TaxID=2881255 RepID=UPI001CF87EDD|nr:glycosyltransferase family 4 protein [Leisingera sp. McT4-56]MCB4458423.1 glycosyltransferase family 4 protein [Leisingera sp. McT4-56]